MQTPRPGPRSDGGTPAGLRAPRAAEAAALRRLLGRRIGRIGFGAVLIATVPVLVLVSVEWPHSAGGESVLVLLVGWGLAIAASVLGRSVGAALRVVCPRLFVAPASGGPSAPVAGPAGGIAAATLAERLASLSFVLPLVGLSLLLPLTLHAPVLATLKPGLFPEWVGLSAVLVGHAHVVLAILAGAYAHRVALGLPRGRLTPVLLVLVPAGVAAVPGILLLALPPLLTLVTGAAFVPAMLGFARRTAQREREILAGWVSACRSIPLGTPCSSSGRASIGSVLSS